MTHLPLETVQSAVLYDDLHKMPAQDAFFSFVVAQLNEKLSDTAGQFTAVNAPDGGGFGLIANPQNTLHITVEIMHAQMQMAGFQTVLNCAHHRGQHPALLDAIRTHKGAVLIGVGLGTTPFPLDHPVISQLGMAEELGGHQDQAKFELRLLILQTLSSIICRGSEPVAVHWSQSHQVFLPETFVKHAESGFSLPLYIGCGAYGTGVGSHQKMGVRGYGSQHILGHLVQFEPGNRPALRSYDAMLAFVAYCRQMGRVLADGETFQETNGDVIEVAHVTTSDIPVPQIMLRVRSEGLVQASTTQSRSMPAETQTQTPTREELPSGFVDLRAAMKNEAPKSSGPKTPKVARPRPLSRPDPASKATPAISAASGDRLRQAMMRANTGATPHSLTAAPVETPQPKKADTMSEMVPPVAASEGPETPMGAPTEASPTDWIKDHVHDHSAPSTVMRDRLIKIALGCVCIYAVLQILAPMSDIMSITTLN